MSEARDALYAALASMPLGTSVRVVIGAAFDKEMTVAELLQIAPLRVASFEVTDNLKVRLTPGGTQIGVLPKGTVIEVLPGASVDWARVLLYISRDYVRGV